MIIQNICAFICLGCFLSAHNIFLVVTGGKCPFVGEIPHKTERGLFCRFFLIEAIRERSALRDQEWLDSLGDLKFGFPQWQLARRKI